MCRHIYEYDCTSQLYPLNITNEEVHLNIQKYNIYIQLWTTFKVEDARDS